MCPLVSTIVRKCPHMAANVYLCTCMPTYVHLCSGVCVYVLIMSIYFHWFCDSPTLSPPLLATTIHHWFVCRYVYLNELSASVCDLYTPCSHHSHMTNFSPPPLHPPPVRPAPQAVFPTASQAQPAQAACPPRPDTTWSSRSSRPDGPGCSRSWRDSAGYLTTLSSSSWRSVCTGLGANGRWGEFGYEVT